MYGLISFLHITANSQNLTFCALIFIESNDQQYIVLKVVIGVHRLTMTMLLFFRQTHPAQPAGSILSTADDMAKWLQFHLNEGDINGQQLLPKEKLKETYLPQMPSTAPLNKRDMVKPTYPVTDISMSYNMGWETNVHRGKFCIPVSVHYELKQTTKEK